MIPALTGVLAASGGGVATSYESISTVTVGSGGTATVDFTSIPQTFAHLQIRILCRSTSAATNDGILMRVGTGGVLDTTSTMWGHYVMGDGATASAGSRSSTNVELVEVTAATATASVFGVAVIDILNYSSTTKNKTFRSLTGYDRNGAGEVRLMSGSYTANTSALDTIRFYSAFANVGQYSSFALYGVKA